MKAIRPAISLAAAALVAWGIYAFCWLPYRCNILKKELEPATTAAYHSQDSPGARMVARRTVARLEKCLRAGCRDVPLDLQLAVNYTLLGRPDDARAMYEHALTVDRRPELYLYLAQIENATGKSDAALAHILRSVSFDPWGIRNIDDPILREAAIKALIAAHPNDEGSVRFINGLRSDD